MWTSKQYDLSNKALVGKIRTTKKLNIKAVKEIIAKAWGNYKELHITELGQNMFLFSFHQEADAKEVLTKAPWFIMNFLMCLDY